MVRVAVIDEDSCKPKKCNYECISVCPVNKSKKGIAIDADMPSKGKPTIYEDVCIGCGLCIKACPFDAISIVNLPEELEEEAVHRYSINGFKLYSLPIPKAGQVVGILGKNGTGKTTAIKILAGELKPNLGILDRDVEYDEIIKRFRGSELQTYFQKIANKKIKAAHKIQYIDLVPRHLKGDVKTLLKKADERGIALDLGKQLNLDKIYDRDVRNLSGGELQKLVIAATLSKEADIYIFDEPSSYLDVKERINVSKIIMNEAKGNKYFLIVEHDLAVLDYLSDFIHIIYGDPGVYGIVSKPYGVRVGINNYLDGYLPSENMRIRKEPIQFRKIASESIVDANNKPYKYLEWDNVSISRGSFKLDVDSGYVMNGEVIGIIGPNAIGKTTFIKFLAGEIKPENGNIITYKELKISYKPQYIGPEMFQEGLTVEDILRNANPESIIPNSWLYLELIQKLNLNRMFDREARSLSGGEMQKLAIAATLSSNADLYLLDEPSAHLDVEERLAIAKIIRRLTEIRKVTAFVAEHDIIILDFISDRIIVFNGNPGIYGHAEVPKDTKKAMNQLLSDLKITIRRDSESGRPRINKEGSYLDRLQKTKGEFYATT
ncbi:putative ATPase, Rnase L inhibitor (RLI) like protein [Caldisphaera lagunensis DSM 15908]|uniref:Putative ATPase, Rnase L inhibitor (RLI) like protein n=1 Tax=Caldisphaera lagunensis (strain DSM 15908 / JCM 11604 / ANMR 0165 / IC-154) TaxID=1056495 RepID=L0ADE2_CALLD|nr:ribosome biogenesis/translation initiation ATPase RLI [Caldisphaera lagunensis]AFZ71070.1 putative ATPase, Rnase L inhibitor (RLI) like protein [Caldisphaera lagunensis DSM 15908]